MHLLCASARLGERRTQCGERRTLRRVRSPNRFERALEPRIVWRQCTHAHRLQRRMLTCEGRDMQCTCGWKGGKVGGPCAKEGRRVEKGEGRKAGSERKSSHSEHRTENEHVEESQRVRSLDAPRSPMPLALRSRCCRAGSSRRVPHSVAHPSSPSVLAASDR